MRRARRVRATGDSSPVAARRTAGVGRTGMRPSLRPGGDSPGGSRGDLRCSGTLCPVDHDVVRKAPLFSPLDEAAAESLIATMSSSRLERGDILFHEGDQGDRLYVIAEGKIKLGRTSSDGRENLLAILGPGAMFGELSLFDPGARTATATAVAETQL